MGRAFLYLIAAFMVLVGINFLINLPTYLLYGSKRSSPSALNEIDLRNIASIKKGISQGYNSRGLYAALIYANGRHNGVDIAAKYGAPIYSPISGKVMALGNQDDFCYKRNYGKFMVIENSDDGTATLFAHLSKIKFDERENVAEGDVLALVGSTGKATAPHLHLAVFKKGTFGLGQRKDCGPNPQGADINPLKYLQSL